MTFYDIETIPSTYDITEVTNLLIHAFFVERLGRQRDRRLAEYVFPIMSHYI